MENRSVVAVDIGGTNTRIAIFPDPAGSPACVSLDLFHTEKRYERQLDRVVTAIRTIKNEASVTPDGMRSEAQLIHYQAHQVSQQTNQVSGETNPIRIGVSIGARLARDGGGVAVAPNLRDYEGRPFVRDLAERFGLPVHSACLAHDPVCGLLAERRFGVLQNADRCAYLTVSTGTGAAIYLGSDNAFGRALSIEFGHQILDGDTRACLCGQTGCLETYTGGQQLAERYGRPLEEIGDVAVWDALYDKLALGLVNLAQLTRIEIVALSGSIALKHERFLDELRERVEARLRGMTLRLELAALREQAPLVGAALLPETPAHAILH
jgi:predicted NBD/HSP70 family sugar kinase